MFTSYQETLDYLYHHLPMFQRIGAAAFKKDLTNTIRLCEVLGNPQLKFKSVHVAGTNGKGSTSHMIASVLQSAGYKTGLYTSPHLKSFTERIRINGQEITQAFVVDFVNRIHRYIDDIQPSFFEITVAMAFDYFVQQGVDVAVVEVGLGGRLDSTNVIKPELCVITNIGWDHKDLLGDTLEKIAYEKAGIIKSEVPVVVSERQVDSERVFEAKATSTGSALYFASDEYHVTAYTAAGTQRLKVNRHDRLVFDDLYMPLQGFYQRKNLAGVLKALDMLEQRGFKITLEQRKHGLVHVIEQTGLKGRWQQLGDSPLTVCDTGHNQDGIVEVVHQIKAQRYKKLHMVWGSVKDKDLSAILQLLPKDAIYYFCQAKIPRALPADALAALASGFGLQGVIVPDVNEAIRLARDRATAEDMIFIGGSTFVVAEIENL